MKVLITTPSRAPTSPHPGLHAVTLIGLAISYATGWLIASALSWMAWMAVLSVLFILAGDSFLGLRDVSWATSVSDRTEWGGSTHTG